MTFDENDDLEWMKQYEEAPAAPEYTGPMSPDWNFPDSPKYTGDGFDEYGNYDETIQYIEGQVQALQKVIEENASADLVSELYGAARQNTFRGAGAPVSPVQTQDTGSTADRVGDVFKSVTGFMEKNKKFTELMAAGIAGYFGDKSKNQAAIEQQNNAARIEKERTDAISNAVVGLRKPKGLIQQPLKRLDGSRVFQNNGRVA